MSDSEKKWPEAYKAIQRHAGRGNIGGWNEIRKEFPEVSDATFWRYVREVRKSQADEMSVSAARKRLTDCIESTASKRLEDEENRLDVNLIPSEVLGFRKLNLMSQAKILFDDIELLRESALDKNGTVAQSHFFAQSISLRDRALNSALKCAEAICDMHTMLDFYDTVVAEVAAVSPDIAREIMERFKELANGPAVPNGRIQPNTIEEGNGSA